MVTCITIELSPSEDHARVDALFQKYARLDCSEDPDVSLNLDQDRQLFDSMMQDKAAIKLST